MTATNDTGVTRAPDALRAAAYENYATAQYLHTIAHRCWMRSRRIRGNDDPNTVQALSVAAEAAMFLGDAKAHYDAAKTAVLEAA